MYTPLNYDKLNYIAGHYSPALVKSYNNKQFDYWVRALYQRIASVLEIDGLPEEWEGNIKDFFIYCLLRFGYVGVFKDPTYGLCFQPGTLYGFNFYYQPTEFILSNPKLNKRFTIGEDCELLKLSPDFLGVYDIIVYFAEKLAALDGAISQSIINSRFSYMILAKNKAAAETLKAAFDKQYRGDPVSILDAKTILPDDPTSEDAKPFQLIERSDVANSYLTSMQLQDMQTILSNFDAEIGINNVPYQKKERMVTDEANMRKEDATARATTWINTLNSTAGLVNKMFGTNLSFNLKEPEDEREEVLDNAYENDDNRD